MFCNLIKQFCETSKYISSTKLLRFMTDNQEEEIKFDSRKRIGFNKLTYKISPF